MSSHSPAATLRHIEHYLVQMEIIAYGKGREDLDDDPMFRYACERLITIVGEAVTRLPDELTLKYSHVPWHAFRGARNFLMHGYDLVDPDRVWGILTTHREPLLKEIRSILDLEQY